MIGLMTADMSMLFIIYRQYGTLPRWSWMFLLRLVYYIVFFVYLFPQIDSLGTSFFQSPFHILLVAVVYIFLVIGVYMYTYFIPIHIDEKLSCKLPTKYPVYIRYDILKYAQYWFTFTALFTIPTLYFATIK